MNRAGRRGTAAVVAIAALGGVSATGCDKVLGLDAIARVDGGIFDGRMVDGAVLPCQVGHDEDGDGFDDCVDNCPGIPNAGQEDLLESATGGAPDGVGDACDPNPRTGGDRIAWYESFTDSTAAGQLWKHNNGTWALASGSLYDMEGQATGYASDLAMQPEPTPPFTVEFRVVIDAITGANAFSLEVDADPAASGITCGLKPGSPPGTPAIIHMDNDYNTMSAETPLGVALTVTQAYQGKMTFDPNATATCTFTPEGGIEPPPATLQFSLPLAVPSARMIGFESAGIQAHVTYVIVYNTAP